MVCLSVCLSITIVRCAKAAEPIEMRLGCELEWAQEIMYSMGSSPMRKSNFGEERGGPL